MMSTPQVHSIPRASLRSLALPNAARITDVEHLASYNWIEAATPTIAVPGSPAVWSNVKQGKQVKKDSGLIYIAQNAARHPDYPLEPLFRAVDIEKPDFDMSSVDIVSDRNNIRKLLSFVDPSTLKGGLDPFTINVEVAGQTVIFCRNETAVTEFLGPKDFKGFGHEFEKAFTKDEIAGSTGHHRIINYRFHDLNMVIRHETDGYVRASTDGGDGSLAGMLEKLTLDLPGETSSTSIPASKMTIKKVGQEVPLASTLEIKTRVAHKPLSMDEVAAQLWISQTPKLVRAYHAKGFFQVPTVNDASADVKSWEKKNQTSLTTLAALMRKIVEVVKPYGRAVIKYDAVKGTLEISKVDAEKKMLPEDVYNRWTKIDIGNDDSVGAAEGTVNDAVAHA